MWSQSDIKLPTYGRIIELIYKIDIKFLFVGKVSNGSFYRKISMGSQHSRTLNCPWLRSGQLRGQKGIVYVEISLEKKPLFTYSEKINIYFALQKSGRTLLMSL